MTQARILIWYRADLRLHDHEPLKAAVEKAQATSGQIVPVYCFDLRQLGKTSFGFPKTGAFRAQFLLESVADLRRSLRAIGSALVLRQGLPHPATSTASNGNGLAASTSRLGARDIYRRTSVQRSNVCENLGVTTLNIKAFAFLPDVQTTILESERA